MTDEPRDIPNTPEVRERLEAMFKEKDDPLTRRDDWMRRRYTYETEAQKFREPEWE
jgi:hypothetical protein